MGRMEDSAHQENMLSAARAGKFTKADLEAACSIASAAALKGAKLQATKNAKALAKLVLELAEAVDNAANDIGGSRPQLDILREAVQVAGRIGA